MKARGSFLAGALSLAGLLGAGCGGVGGAPAPAPPPAAMSAEEQSWAQEVCDLVNVERRAAGIPELAWDSAAAAVAYEHAADMAFRAYFDHQTPEGATPADRLAASGLDGLDWGENIAMGQRDPVEVVADWMSSEGHRENILDARFERLGVGVRFDRDGPFWVQDFLGE